jgi:hypothetical protein
MEWLCLKPSNASFALLVRRCDYDFFRALLSDFVQVGPVIPTTTEHDRHFADVDGNHYRAVEMIPIVIAKLDQQEERPEGKEGSVWLQTLANDELSN